jgi:lipopolysaccharide/colanic/teichoic acid biosynthesis glycosyltransferase
MAGDAGGRRALDVAIAGTMLALSAPLLAVAVVAVRFSGPGPVLYRAPRAGRHGRPFTMLKFRTMRVGEYGGSAVTAAGDARVFPAGAVLRRLKIDELPQLVNVLRGDMAIVGPRPEDPGIIDDMYRPEHMETLDVRPGLASPGSIYNYTHGEALLVGPDPRSLYRDQLLPLKLALEVVYVRRASVAYDLSLVARTATVLLATLVGRRRFSDPPEMVEARALVAEWSAAGSVPAPQGRK